MDADTRHAIVTTTIGEITLVASGDACRIGRREPRLGGNYVAPAGL